MYSLTFALQRLNIPYFDSTHAYIPFRSYNKINI